MRLFSEEEFNEIKSFNFEITMYDADKFSNPVDAILAGEAHAIHTETNTEDYEHIMDFYTGAYSITKALGKGNMAFTYLYYGYDVARDLIDTDKQLRSDNGVEAFDYMVTFLANLISSLESNIVIGNKTFTNEDLNSDTMELIFKADYLGQASISGVSLRKIIEVAEKNELKSRDSIDNVKKYIDEHKIENEDFNKVMKHQQKIVMYNKAEHLDVKTAILADDVHDIELNIQTYDLYSIKDFFSGSDNILEVVNKMDKTGLVQMSAEWVVYGYDINYLWDCLSSSKKLPNTERDIDGKYILILVLERILEKAECSIKLDGSISLTSEQINIDNLDLIMNAEFRGKAFIEDVVDLSIADAIKHLSKNEYKYEESEF